MSMQAPTAEEIDALIILRTAEFHDAMVRRGQIPPPPPAEGVTADYRADQGAGANQSRRQFG